MTEKKDVDAKEISISEGQLIIFINLQVTTTFADKL